MLIKARVRKSTRGPLCHYMVLWLLVQLGDEVGPTRLEVTRSAWLLCPTRRTGGDIDENDGQAVLAKGCDQPDDLFHYTIHRVHGGERDNTLLEIDNDERGLGVEGSYGHGRFFR